MKVILLWLCLVILLTSAHRLPAPISEAPTPPPAPAKPREQKPKPTELQSASSSQSAKRFDGTWVSAQSGTTNEDAYKAAATLVIKDGAADLSQENTLTLLPTKTWSWLPDPYKKTSPVYLKGKRHSVDLSIDGSNLRIRWPEGGLLDWTPKSIPRNIMEAAANKPLTSIYTLKGNRLTRDFDSSGYLIFTRAN